MKNILYYFTGTGNSLAAAKEIAAGLGETELIAIPSLMDTPGTIVPEADRVGIVCPVYFQGLPLMVAEFAERLDRSRSPYIFAVVTMGESGGGAALRQMDRLIRKRNNHGLDAGFFLKMPGNYIFMYSSPQGKKQADLLSSAEDQIAGMVPVIRQCEHQGVPWSLFGGLAHALVYPYFRSRAHARDLKFTVTDACTSCGTCAAVCPAGNIDIVEGRPVWKHHCEVCCGCIHLCPAKAILGGPKTAERLRYRNPSVSLKELEWRKKSQ